MPFALLAIMSLSCELIRHHQGEVTVINDTGEEIAQGSVEVCNQRFAFIDLKPGNRKQFFYSITAESQYTVAVKFASGREVTNDIGYVTSGFDFSDVLILGPTNVVIKPGPH